MEIKRGSFEEKQLLTIWKYLLLVRCCIINDSKGVRLLRRVAVDIKKKGATKSVRLFCSSNRTRTCI